MICQIYRVHPTTSLQALCAPPLEQAIIEAMINCHISVVHCPGFKCPDLQELSYLYATTPRTRKARLSNSTIQDVSILRHRLQTVPFGVYRSIDESQMTGSETHRLYGCSFVFGQLARRGCWAMDREQVVYSKIPNPARPLSWCFRGKTKRHVVA